MILGACLGAVAVSGIAAVYVPNMIAPEYAQVTSIDDVTETSSKPKQICHNIAVTKQRAVKDKEQIAGTALGAALGGVIGHQVGGGSGKKWATLVAAAAGGFAGNKVQENMQVNDTYTEYEQRCETVYERHQKVVAYDVNYSIGEEKGIIRLKQKPTQKQLPLKDGQVDVSALSEEQA